MLKNTFIHIPGIGSITEQRLWNSGITDWNTTFDNTPVPISSNIALYDGATIQTYVHGQNLDGFFAVLLWNEYRKSGNQKALDTLLAYNVQAL